MERFITQIAPGILQLFGSDYSPANKAGYNLPHNLYFVWEIKVNNCKRSFEVQAIAAQTVNMSQHHESLVQNYQPIHQQRPTTQSSVEIPLLPIHTIPNPTAPLISRPYVPTQPAGNPTFAQPYVCQYQVYGCYCSDPNNATQIQCLSTLQSNPRVM